MAWNPSPKVADARDIARKWNKQQIIILAVDKMAGTLEFASFGTTVTWCAEARVLAEAAYAAMYSAIEEQEAQHAQSRNAPFVNPAWPHPATSQLPLPPA